MVKYILKNHFSKKVEVVYAVLNSFFFSEKYEF